MMPTGISALNLLDCLLGMLNSIPTIITPFLNPQGENSQKPNEPAIPGTFLK
jgi:hypothetical protein